MSGTQPKYILTERIAQGGMAEIHLGKSIGSDGFARVCAFKRILPHFAADTEFIQMFRNEAMVAKQLQNKNIVQVYDFVGDGQSFMLVMEFVDGQDLRSVLAAAEQAKKRIPIEIACYIAIEVISGLAYAHAAVDVSGKSMGIIHRDVSPQNVLISYEGDVKITDFGIAKAENQSSTTRAGVLKGKFRYMSPEQAMGQSIDARTDIFAVGVILYEMVTMTRLFKGEDMVVLEAVRKCAIRPPSQVKDAKVPPELENVIMKLLSRDPAKRYLSGRDAVKDLSKFLYSYRPDFFAGEMSEFMQLLFREKIASARERLRSTLALPVGAMGAGGSIDAMGRLDPFAPASTSGVVDLSRPGVSAAQLSQSFAAGMGGFHPQARPSRPMHGPGGMRGSPNSQAMNEDIRLEVVGGRKLGVNKGTMTGPRTGPTRAQRQRMNMQYSTRTTQLPRAGLSTESKIGLFIASCAVIFIGLGVMLKTRAVSFQSELEIGATPASGRFLVDVNGVKLFNGAYQPLPVRLRLESGTHRITLYRLGFKPRRLTFEAPLTGKKAKEHLILEKENGGLGQVRIVTNPPGADVTLDPTFDAGQTPYTFEYLPVGRTYTFRVKHPKCGAPLVIREALKPGDERQLVVRTFNLKGCKR